jgi:hypothetical protein
VKKTRYRRTPAHKVSKKQRAAAIEKLAAIVDDGSTPSYVAAKAAAAIIAAADRDTEHEPKEGDSERKIIVLPWNKRPSIQAGAPVLPRFGITGDPDQAIVIIPPGFDHQNPQPEAHYAAYVKAWWRGHHERMAAVKARMAASGVVARPVVKLPDGTFKFADEVEPSPGDGVWRKAQRAAAAAQSDRSALPALPPPESE